MRSLFALRRFFASTSPINLARKYTNTHEWIEYYPQKKVARVGISNYAQQQLGEIVFIDLPPVGKVLAQHESAVVIESVKIAADVYTPVAGKVTGFNQQVQNDPTVVNANADLSWLFEITYVSEAPGLLDEVAYKEFVSVS